MSQSSAIPMVCGVLVARQQPSVRRARFLYLASLISVAACSFCSSNIVLDYLSNLFTFKEGFDAVLGDGKAFLWTRLESN